MPPETDHHHPHLIESLVRRSYGRLLAMLSVRSGDLASAEDALASAFESALKNWPEQGAPNNPEAWLFTVARRQLIDQARSAQTQQRHQEEFSYLLDEAAAESDPLAIPDQIYINAVAIWLQPSTPSIKPLVYAPIQRHVDSCRIV
jgi:RNA polymerase sigma-70 factor, ECF subfamily